MTVAGVASAQTKKLMKFSLSLFRRGFNPSKCKTAAKMAVARIKLLRNKRQVVVKQMRRDIAMLLQSGQDATARIRVEHVIREQNVLAANEIIELFCELIVSRLTIITKQRECPADLKEGIASLIFAAPRCSEVPELEDLRDIFEKKYGKDFVSAATDLRPSCGVNRMLVDKLSVRNSSGQFKLKIMKEIAKEFQVEWDTTETEQELLKPPEEVLKGPSTFVSASSLPINPPTDAPVDRNPPVPRSSSSIGVNSHYRYTESKGESAKKGATRDVSEQSVHSTASTRQSRDSETSSYFGKPPLEGKRCGYYDEETETREEEAKEIGNLLRRHSYNSAGHKDYIKFDESDNDDVESDVEEGSLGRVSSLPPNRPPPQAPPSETRRDSGGHHVHPKLPDYDILAARFESLKHRRSSLG